MPDQIINIPGVGDVAFPDSMSDHEVSVAAKRLYDEATYEVNPLGPGPAIGVLKGIGKSAASTLVGISELVDKGIRMIPGNEQTGGSDEAYAAIRENLAPTNRSQKVGQMAEQAIEFSGAVSKAPGLVNRALRSAAGALESPRPRLATQSRLPRMWFLP